MANEKVIAELMDLVKDIANGLMETAKEGLQKFNVVPHMVVTEDGGTLFIDEVPRQIKPILVRLAIQRSKSNFAIEIFEAWKTCYDKSEISNPDRIPPVKRESKTEAIHITVWVLGWMFYMEQDIDRDADGRPIFTKLSEFREMKEGDESNTFSMLPRRGPNGSFDGYSGANEGMGNHH